MGTMIELSASDGHTLGAYKAEPSGSPKGGVVVIQEIFGVNQHIRNQCDFFANQGYVAIAPALFDRVEKGLELGYGQDDFGKGRDTRGALEERVRHVLESKQALFDGLLVEGKDRVDLGPQGRSAFIDRVRSLMETTSSLDG